MSTTMGKKASPLLADSFSFSTIKNSHLAFSAVWINFCCFADQVTQDELENCYKSRDQGFIYCETKEIGTQTGNNVTTGKALNGGVRRKGCLICPCSLQGSCLFFHSKLWILNAGCTKLSFRKLSRLGFLRVFTEYVVLLQSRKKNQNCWTSKTPYL